MDTYRITQNLDPEPNRDLTQQLQAGETLAGRYLIDSVIGVGGMGAVYRARDLHFPNVVKLVAVKEMVNLAPDPMARATIIRNFEREANILATLDHRAIPRIYDYFTINERSYLVLEYVNGKDLEAIINERQEPLSELQVVTWAIELCDVLHFLHTLKPEPIVFRDMKPSNVMVNQQDHIVLVDFGIAKTFQTGQRGTMIGTEGYSPPEQYRGEATPQADIYALGATLHHLMTRRDPRLEAPFSFAERPIRKYNPNISPELEAVIFKALQYNPEDRFRTAEEMKKALLAAAKKTGLLPHVPFPTASTVEENQIRPVWTFECEDEIRGTPLFHEGIVYTGSYDNNLYALSAADGEFQWKYPTEGGIVSRPAAFEGHVYFGSEDTRLYVITARGGRINWTHYTRGPVRSSPTIAEGHVFIGSDDGYLHALNAATGRLVWSTDAGSAIRSTPLVFHENVYFGTQSGEFYCLNFNGSIRWRFSAKRAITSSPVISQGIVYFGSVDSTLYALDCKSGWVIWRYRFEKPSISTPCIHDNLLFTGATDGNIYCIDASTAKEVWRFTTEHQVTGSPIFYNDSVYCGSVDGHLYCLDYRTGRLRWKFMTGGPITGTPAVNGDKIYNGSLHHKLYALTA